MFALNIRSIFGDTIDCRINGKPKRVTWRDEHTLVIEPDPYATAPVDTDKFGASWTGLEALASQLRGDCTQEEFARLIGGCRPTGAAERGRGGKSTSVGKTGAFRLVHRGV
jgi:hypothetical protein